MRTRNALATFAVLAVAVAVGAIVIVHLLHHSLPAPIRTERCTVTGTGEVTLSPDQMANAATITAVGVARKMPDRAVTIALATALQESKLENLSGGDRDSVGLFQQRPSQGWGTPKQISDPRYAAGKFYSALKRVHNWQKMSITAAAQAVQRSGHPDAYQQWAAEASVLSRALLGDVSHAVSCQVGGTPAARGTSALTALATDLVGDWGSRAQPVPATATGTMALFVASSKDGWQYAHWLVAHAQDRGVERVRFGDQQWTAKAGTWTTTGAKAAADTVTAQVFGG